MLDKEGKEEIDNVITAITTLEIPDNLLNVAGAVDYALHSAVKAGNDALVKWLLDEKSADVQAYDDQGFTPLHMAITHNNGKIASLLVRHGADVNAQDRTGEPISRATPLHWVLCTIKNIKAIHFLLEHGANPNARSENNAPPLQWLINAHFEEHSSEEWISKEIDIMSLLLESGASPSATYYTTEHMGRGTKTLLSSAMDIHTPERRNKMTKLLMAHILLENPDANKPDRVSNIAQLSQFWDLCLTEIQELKNVTISEHCSYYDFCKIDIDELVKIVSKRELNAFKELENPFVQFPNFSAVLQNKLEKLKERDKILGLAKRCTVTNNPEGKIILDNDSQETILEALPTKALNNFNKASLEFFPVSKNKSALQDQNTKVPTYSK